MPVQGARSKCDIRSCSTVDGKPIKAIYTSPLVNVVAAFDAQIYGKRTRCVLPLPQDLPVVCEIVDLQTLSVYKGTVRYVGEARIRRGNEIEIGSRFLYGTEGGTPVITLDSRGEFVRFKSPSGIEMVRDPYREEDAQNIDDLSR